MRYLVAYDVSDNRVRNRVAERLEGAGLRVQESVFECDLAPPDLAQLAADLADLLGDPPAGGVRVYRLCRDCLAASSEIGAPARGSGDGPCIIL